MPLPTCGVSGSDGSNRWSGSDQQNPPTCQNEDVAYRAVVSRDVLFVAQLLQDGLCEHFTKLHAHLVVRVDSPDSTLYVDLVLVHCNQRPQSPRSEPLEHDRICRLVALEDFRFHQSSIGRCGSQLLTDLVLCLSKCEGSKVIPLGFARSDQERWRAWMPRGGRLTHSGCAKKFERRISWCFPPEIGLSVSTGARKSLKQLARS